MPVDFVAVADGLIAGSAEAPELIGSECRRCGVVAFPRQGSCAACTSSDVQERRLARRGTLWTWTIQCFPPKSAVRRRRRGLRAVRRRLRRAAGRGARRGAAHRGRPEPAADRDADGAGADPGAGRRRCARPTPSGRMTDVAVVGVGIHPFGRHEGVSGLEMAAVAARAALADAGVGWQEVEFAAGGSDAAGNADTTVVGARPHRRAVHQRPQRLRDRRLGARDRARDAGGRRRGDRARRRASTSTRRARSTRCRRTGGWAPGTARPGSCSRRSSSP